MPGDLNRWTYSAGGKVVTEHWAFKGQKNRDITVYVFDPNAPAISARYFPQPLFGHLNLQCPAKAAPSKIEPEAARKKNEAGQRKKKDAEEPEPEKRKAEGSETEEREAKKARATKEAGEAKKERERLEKQALEKEQEEERHRQRERARLQVLPRKGVTAAWPAKVLPTGKSDGVTAAWPTRVLPTATGARGAASMPCAPLVATGLWAPKLAGGKDSSATMAVREPILKALLAHKKAKSEAEKEAHRQSLRKLFAAIGDAEAQGFQAMLRTHNTLGVTFRDVLGDPVRRELLGILEKKYAPAQCTPAAPSPAPQASEASQGVTLPSVTLTDEGAFEELHKLVGQRIDALGEGAGQLSGSATVLYKDNVKKSLVPFMRGRLTKAQQAKEAAFRESDGAKKTEAMKRAGAAYVGLLYLTQMVLLELNMSLIVDWADAEGVASGALTEALLAYDGDKDILALTQASMDADAARMAATLPAGIKRFDDHLTRLDQWIAAIQKGAVLSKKVIKVADITMIAISIYQVAKMPVVPAGGSPKPPTLVGVLPGGVAVGSTVSLPSLASALEAIRKLVAIGAIDGALIAGVGKLGGGSAIALPELQRPTSLAVQVPNQPGGSSSGATGQPTRPNPLKGTRYTDKVKAQMRPNLRTGRPDNHGFPLEVDNSAGLGRRTTIVGGDGITRTKIELDGSYNGRPGIFEWIIEPNGTVNHRLFRAEGGAP